MRHLTLEQAAAALRRGKPLEQLLATARHDDQPIVRWLTVNPGRDGFSVRAHHVHDEGSPEFLDLSEFTPVDDDEYGGEGVEMARHVDPEGALEAANAHGADPGRWVNLGMVADEYADSRGWS